MLQCWRRTGHLPSFFVPTLGDLTAQESPPPGICHPRKKKMLMPGGQPGGGGWAGPRWNWLMHYVFLCNLCRYCERNFPASVGLSGDNKVHNKFKNNNKNGNFALLMASWCLFCSQWMSLGQNLLQLVFDKFRNAQLASFVFFLLRLYFCCLLYQDLKGQCRYKNWAVLCWFLPYFKEMEKCT